MISFNIDDGFLEAVVQGFRDGLLRSYDYNNLIQCDTLEDIKLHLTGTDYGNFLQNEATLSSTIIVEKATERLVKEFNELRFQAVEPLSTFLDYITYDYMILNVLKLVFAVRNGKGALDILYKCHPLGLFESLSAITAATSVEDMYELVLIDSPIGKFFTKTETRDFDEYSTDYLRGLLQKNYLESFYDFVQSLGGTTAEVMSEILEFEADRAVLTITRQSYAVKEDSANKLPKDERKKLYPNFGQLLDVQDKLAECDDDNSMLEILKPYPFFYETLQSVSKQTSLESLLKKKAVELNKTAFEQQFHYGAFYSFVKLREQEINNLLWISECIHQGQKHRINEYTPIYE
ncbi:hypothetical protein FDP41_006170 [Naegleria fowleri]|uniref:V-type proton ATPase subunit n=1 Tax=Naegleria fowleri TaxID=5763 RepID=A0A6A5BIR0_NAEFO|nr:uncharacterized protein FDP41_006170 [Naegleria fowleri]KAF0974696.1 hypothetical protein FDP41_006170 [Naegleria fowleri]CAG4712598.1 unnamed protein product [Naegleria fowleri]